ncbi:hypothetical protein [Sphingomonas quercus]|uniref:Uncharacterized protein n=1 Tax=Sphingomonas quercus TaxID=2842451 RepID=A0ABS6BI27_9SPHN|nr:hypothetical protein [Sphingomonas quercus]MBU3077960.1 hypothetical protein [Sphingomonas quercus]
MLHYRLYTLSDGGGGISSGADLLAETDEEAIRQAERAEPIRAYEVWQGTRRVHTRPRNEE